MRKKRIIAAIATVALVATLFAGCGKKAETPAGDAGDPGEKKEVVKIGMVTDSGTIDDKSFNQGTWEGIKKYVADNSDLAEEKYLQPSGEQHTDYLNAINDLVDTDHKIIVTPGFKFETAVNEAAELHKDNTFILIDGSTHNGDYNFVKHDNTVCVFFNEHEAGFLAGVAAALSTKTGKLGFIGGMEIPPVQRFGWGFKAGVKYADDKFGVKAEIVDYVYQGSFNDTPAGQTLAAGMYNKGIDIIFHAAGGVGVGIFKEAIERAGKGEEVYVVGVDVDQYEQGKLPNGKSVTLTSAMKRLGDATYKYLDSEIVKKDFPGGEVITLGLKDEMVGLPLENPNLTEDVQSKVKEVEKDILDGIVTVPATQKDLDGFLK